VAPVSSFLFFFFIDSFQFHCVEKMTSIQR
jgi:hypothetical protein